MTSHLTKQNIVAFAVGVFFAIGLAISGMTQPHKVINFLDPWNWDPSLLFVMVGALVVHGISYIFIKKQRAPLFDTKWHLPTRKDLTVRLVLGSALFGIGWGIGGFCPGPGLASIGSGNIQALLFVVAMISGMILFKKTVPYLKLKE